MRDLIAARTAPRACTSAIVRQLPPASRHLLRGPPQVMAAAGDALSLSISLAPCRASQQRDRAALWLGPDEQLLLSGDAAGAETSRLLQHALRGMAHSLVDVSHRQIALAVSGPHAAPVLNAGCPLDLHASAFPVGMCTRTVLGKAQVVLWRTGEQDFHVEVWRSFTHYVARFLDEAGRGLDP